MQPYGSSDYPFQGGLLKGYGHAHLRKEDSSKINRDYFIVYRIHGRNPYVIDLYGIFSHEDLGTGTPPKRNIQTTMATKFGNQQFVEPKKDQAPTED